MVRRFLILLFQSLVVAIAGLTLVSCGGGSNGSASGGNTATGSVSLLMTDLPTEQYCEINVTISKALLIGDAGQVTLYSSQPGKTFNLLALAHYSEVFSHTSGVPAGTYAKIRLILDGDVQLKPSDSCQDANTWIEARVPSQKIDFNPQGDFTVPDNGVLVVELDMDAKAFKLTRTGNGKYIVRPVVFVKVMADDDAGKLVREFGTVQNWMQTTEGGSFDLCRTSIAWHNDDDNDDGKDNDGDARCIKVGVNDGTSIFDALGDPIAFDDLGNGDLTTVVGRLAVSTMSGYHDDDDSDHDRVVLNAEVVELGDRDVFGRYRGIVRSLPPAADGAFDLELSPPQGILAGTIVPVNLQSGTRLYSSRGESVTTDEMDLGQHALVEGVLVIGAEDFIKSSIVWLDLHANQMLYEGHVDPGSVNPAERVFTLMPTSTTLSSDRLVRVANKAVILLVSETGTVLSNAHITLEEMASLSGIHDAEVYGTELPDGSILSDRIILQARTTT